MCVYNSTPIAGYASGRTLEFYSLEEAGERAQLQYGLGRILGRAHNHRAVERFALAHDKKVRDAKRACRVKLAAQALGVK